MIAVSLRRLRSVSGSVALAALLPATAAGQAIQPPTPRIQLPVVTVVAQKEPADPRTLPVSVTTISREWLRRSGATFISDAAMYAPNTYFTEFGPRKLSFPRFRGIGVGSGPLNPGVATYIDGVPQLNSNSSSIDLLDVEQIEFVRGPASALFGRNALGGVVNVLTARPSLTTWTGGVDVPFGNYDARDLRANVSGPLRRDELAVSGAVSYGRRDGFTVNDMNGRDIDSRSSFSAKGQLLWTPSAAWNARVIVSGERARDGDYGLHDLTQLRQRPLHAARDFEGYNDRDLLSTTVESRYEGRQFSMTSATGIVRWKTKDVTDLDYSPGPFATRDNAEKDLQFTQEVRFASAPGSAVKFGRGSLKWQAGAVFFTQTYEQTAVNAFSASALSPFIPFPVAQTSPDASLDDVGVGLYGQATATLHDRIDLTAGARFDHEQKDALLKTFFNPAISQPVTVDADRSFSDVSPQFSAAARLASDRMVYATVGRGFRAGGFNPTSPVGFDSYGEEHAWHYEGGIKALSSNGRLSATAAVFYIDWDDLQLNVPNPLVPAQFYIANVGSAKSKGVELEVVARPQAGLDLFAAISTSRARFADGSASSGADVSGKKLPSTPDYQLSVGGSLSRDVRRATIYGHAEAVVYGAFQYDDANTLGQDAYSLVNVRAGARGKWVFAEAWIRNAFDTRYIPAAFPLPYAPSGFVGENGRPRTFGITGGVRF